MNTKALLLYDQEQPLGKLRATLEKQGVATVRARSCAGALSILLSQDNAPAVVFTDLTVSDGSWADVLRLGGRSPLPVDFIIVSQLVDVPLYIAAMDSGAFDFMVPPFADNDVAYVTRRAADDVARRRSPKKMLAKASA